MNGSIAHPSLRNGQPYLAHTFGHQHAHSTWLYESDGRTVLALLGMEDRVIAQLYTFDKAFAASGCACLSTCQYKLLDELIPTAV
jgi:7-keto-8-aminopelargonate synthetase-like enzyme